MKRNANYLSKFTVDELVKSFCGFTEEKFLHNLGSAGEFAILKDERTDEVDRSQLATYVHYVDSITYDDKEEYLSVRKLCTAKTSKDKTRNNVS